MQNPPQPPALRSGLKLCNAHEREFYRLASGFTARSVVRFPEWGSSLGWNIYDGFLGKNDPSIHRAQIADTAATLARIEAMPDSAFQGDSWLDRRAFLSSLRCSLLENQTFSRWQNNPQTHCHAAVESIFGLSIRFSHNLRLALPSIESRLLGLPDYLSAGADCVFRPVPIWTRLAVEACEGAVEFLNGLEKELLALSKHPRKLSAAFAAACRSFHDYASTIQQKKPGPAKGYCIGRQAFDFLIREKLGLDSSLPSLEAEGRLLVARIEKACQDEARHLGFSSSRTALEFAAASWTPDRPLIELYKESTAALKKQLTGFASTPPGETLTVLPAPPFLRHQFPTAAYTAPPPFARRQRGIFWVNDLSLEAPDEPTRLAEIRQHFGLELTAAHEAYPGHHLQFAIQNRHPSMLRRTFAHSIFYEGWTMWCEKQMIEQGCVIGRFSKLQYLHDSLWRAHRITIDCGLHSGRLTPSAAARQLVNGVGFTPARARADVNWYTSAPTVPMSYLLGRIELEKLHNQLVVQRGWPLKKFHDTILSCGALPWSWLRTAHPDWT
ncbi:MAG: hypothetical protein Fur0032_08380 [Terrimicrobiaceae bacterium]